MKSIRLAVILLCLIITSCIDNNTKKENATNKSLSAINKEQGKIIKGRNKIIQLHDTIIRKVYEDTEENIGKPQWHDEECPDVDFCFWSREDYISLIKELVEVYRKNGNSLDSAIIKFSDKEYNITVDSITKWWNAIPY